MQRARRRPFGIRARLLPVRFARSNCTSIFGSDLAARQETTPVTRPIGSQRTLLASAPWCHSLTPSVFALATNHVTSRAIPVSLTRRTCRRGSFTGQPIWLRASPDLARGMRRINEDALECEPWHCGRSAEPPKRFPLAQVGCSAGVRAGQRRPASPIAPTVQGRLWLGHAPRQLASRVAGRGRAPTQALDRRRWASAHFELNRAGERSTQTHRLRPPRSQRSIRAERERQPARASNGPVGLGTFVVSKPILPECRIRGPANSARAASWAQSGPA